MEKKKHTPEPWKLPKQDQSFVFQIWSGDEKKLIARFPFTHGAGEDSLDEETQRLNSERALDCVNACAGLADPSVVPELYKLLESCSRQLFANGATREELSNIDAALARAKGLKS